MCLTCFFDWGKGVYALEDIIEIQRNKLFPQSLGVCVVGCLVRNYLTQCFSY